MGEAKRKRIEDEMNVALIGGKSCRSCEHRIKMNGIMFCRRYPPQVIQVMRDTPTGPQLAMNASYPPINPDIPCGEYERSDVNAAEEVRDAAASAKLDIRQ